VYSYEAIQVRLVEIEVAGLAPPEAQTGKKIIQSVSLMGEVPPSL